MLSAAAPGCACRSNLQATTSSSSAADAGHLLTPCIFRFALSRESKYLLKPVPPFTTGVPATQHARLGGSELPTNGAAFVLHPSLRVKAGPRRGLQAPYIMGPQCAGHFRPGSGTPLYKLDGFLPSRRVSLMLLLLSAARVSYKGVETRQGTGLALEHDRPLLLVKGTEKSTLFLC